MKPERPPARYLPALRRLTLLATLCAASATANPPAPSAEALPLAAEFQMEVEPLLHPPTDEITAYASHLQQALAAGGVTIATPQFVLLVDKNPQLQAALLFWGAANRNWDLVGAAPVSTGLPGRYEHFTTPLGVFAHTLANPDFRSRGTKNKLGFRGYGRKGMRIYDFGWIAAPRGWGDGAPGQLRLQMHATDPDRLARRLGSAQSEGCVRIPEALNTFIDRHAVLDEDYEKALASGEHLWVLRTDRTPTRWPGRYMVVIDSGRSERPDWSPAPPRR